jgi:hypothetical protein
MVLTVALAIALCAIALLLIASVSTVLLLIASGRVAAGRGRRRVLVGLALGACLGATRRWSQRPPTSPLGDGVHRRPLPLTSGDRG